MNRNLLPVLALSAALSSAATRAAVFERDWRAPGDGLLTYDDVNQREWLDLTETQLFKFPGETLEEQYESVVAETTPGGRFADFVVASTPDVLELAESAGIDIASLSFEQNGASTNLLIGLLGDPIPGAAPANKWAAGFLNDGDLSQSIAFEYVPSARSHPTAGVDHTILFRESAGVWLVRKVPEPAPAALLATAALARVIMPRRLRL